MPEEKNIIEKFEEQFGYCFNIGAVPDAITRNNIKQFLLTELQALKEEVAGEEGKPSGKEWERHYRHSDYYNGWNAHRQHTIEAFKKFGL